MTHRTITDLVQPSPHVLCQYALIADGERGALVGPRADSAFLCSPSWHDDAVFSSLLGGQGGTASARSTRDSCEALLEQNTLIDRGLRVSTQALTSAAKP